MKPLSSLIINRGLPAFERAAFRIMVLAALLVLCIAVLVNMAGTFCYVTAESCRDWWRDVCDELSAEREHNHRVFALVFKAFKRGAKA